MKLIFKIQLLIFLFGGMIKTQAQQNNSFNTYVYDPLQLNIAYAGVPCTEANLHYRKQWIGLKDATTLYQLNAHTSIGKSNGIALRMSSQQVGLFNALQATLGYAYQVKINRTNTLCFGLGVGFIQNNINGQKAVTLDAGDLTLATGKQKATGFDSEIGIMLVGKRMKAGLAAMHLYSNNAQFAGSGYKAMPQFNTNISYVFNKDENVEVEPWLVDKYTISGINSLEGLLNFNFMKTLTVGAGYRNNSGILFFLGIKAGGFKAGYSFDYSTSKNKTVTGTSQQILLGFGVCHSKTTRYKSRGRKIRSRF